MHNKRQQLIEASVNLFAEEGFWNTPTAKIAEHANVAKGTLFNYFETKEVLIESVYCQLKQEWADYVQQDWPADGSIKTRLEHVWFRHIDWAVRFPERYRLIGQLRVSDTLRNGLHDRDAEELAFLYELVEEGFAADIFEDISVDYLEMIMRFHLEAAVRYARRHSLKNMALIKHITKGFQIFWKGVTR